MDAILTVGKYLADIIRRIVITYAGELRPQKMILYPPELGALTQLWAGTMPETLELNGEVSHPG